MAKTRERIVALLRDDADKFERDLPTAGCSSPAKDATTGPDLFASIADAFA